MFRVVCTARSTGMYMCVYTCMYTCNRVYLLGVLGVLVHKAKEIGVHGPVNVAVVRMRCLECHTRYSILVPVWFFSSLPSPESKGMGTYCSNRNEVGTYEHMAIAIEIACECIGTRVLEYHGVLHVCTRVRTPCTQY